MLPIVSFSEAAQLLLAENVGIIPTDTVYGIVCIAKSSKAIGELYAQKHRERKPGTLIAASWEDFLSLGFSLEELSRARPVWPGPISVVLTNTHNPILAQHTGSNACRVVLGPPELIELLRITGPLATSSANTPGDPPACSKEMAHAYFPNIPFIVDGGIQEEKPPSSVITITPNGDITILREGAVGKEEILRRMTQN